MLHNEKIRNEKGGHMKNDKTQEPDLTGMGRSFFLIGLMNRFNNQFQASADAMFRELSWKQVFFLNCVTLFGEAPSIKDVADVVGCSHQNAKQILIKLEKNGFVTLERDETDRRRQRIRVTRKAEDFRREFDGPSMRVMERIFVGVDAEELETTIRVMTHLDDNLRKYQEEKE